MDLPNFDQTNEGLKLPGLCYPENPHEVLDDESGTVEPSTTTDNSSSSQLAPLTAD